MRVQGYIERYQQAERAEWERTRYLAWASFAPHIDQKKSSNFNPQSLFRFEDEKHKEINFSNADIQARIREMRKKD
ncbi:MAG: hypothetical protein AAF738_06285 [Bacteroidota bacterium]